MYEITIELFWGIINLLLIIFALSAVKEVIKGIKGVLEEFIK